MRALLPCEFCRRATSVDLDSNESPCCKNCLWIPKAIVTVFTVLLATAVYFLILEYARGS